MYNYFGFESIIALMFIFLIMEVVINMIVRHVLKLRQNKKDEAMKKDIEGFIEALKKIQAEQLGQGKKEDAPLN